MSVEVSVEVVLDDGPGRRTVLALAWQLTDPLAVRLHLTALPEHPALPRGRWVVLRDSLRSGLDHPVGDGAVKIRPDALGERVWFELDRPGRAACVSVPSPVLADFLAQTERYVASGEETCEQALDDLLARVLYSS
jgi:hypothetical protein